MLKQEVLKNLCGDSLLKMKGKIIMEQLLNERKIEWLLHFTQAENLSNILKFGLLPRSVIKNYGIQSSFNDEYRYDNCLNAVCMSIEFPNYKMFYKLRQDNPDIEWVVLLLDAKILCDFECAFCYTNAGSATMYNIPIEQRMGKEAFLHLFEDCPNGPTRKELNIGDWYPTNPQAEVLVFDSISVDYILKVYFQEEKTFNKYCGSIPSFIKTGIKKKAFSYRKDWDFW